MVNDMRIELDKKRKIIDFYGIPPDSGYWDEIWLGAMSYEEAKEFAKKLLEMLDSV